MRGGGGEGGGAPPHGREMNEMGCSCCNVAGEPDEAIMCERG
jgi:hypothetical protein